MASCEVPKILSADVRKGQAAIVLKRVIGLCDITNLASAKVDTHFIPREITIWGIQVCTLYQRLYLVRSLVGGGRLSWRKFEVKGINGVFSVSDERKDLQTAMRLLVMPGRVEILILG